MMSAVAVVEVGLARRRSHSPRVFMPNAMRVGSVPTGLVGFTEYVLHFIECRVVSSSVFFPRAPKTDARRREQNRAEENPGKLF